MCRINMWHTRVCRITTHSVLKQLKLRSIQTYTVRRQLQWLGHVARMPPDRLPRKFLAAWCYQKRPVGRPEYTYGEGVRSALRYAKVEVSTWMEEAQDREGWKERIAGIEEPAGREGDEAHPVLVRRSEYKPKRMMLTLPSCRYWNSVSLSDVITQVNKASHQPYR